jgi:hypothetical protein
MIPNAVYADTKPINSEIQPECLQRNTFQRAAFNLHAVNAIVNHSRRSLRRHNRRATIA